MQIGINLSALNKFKKKTVYQRRTFRLAGLDHIGHVEGPKGSSVRPKLEEMSDVIDRMGKGLFQKDQMLTGNPPPMMVILGDHGMSDDKGHGGSSAPEATTPLIFIPKPQVWSLTHLYPLSFLIKDQIKDSFTNTYTIKVSVICSCRAFKSPLKGL